MLVRPLSPPKKIATVFEVFRAFLMLGCTGFGGPVAHLAYFRTEFVARRAWLRDEAYADVVALCQFLPGPASSQVGMALGFIRAGVPGAIAAWMGFTVPSAVLLVLFAEWISHQRTPADSLWLHGLAVAIVAVLAQALWGMGRTLCPDRLRAGLAVTAAAAMAWIPGPLTQTICIVLGGLAGWRWGTPGEALPSGTFAVSLGKRTGLGLLCLYGGLLLLPILIGHRGGDAWRLFNTYYHVGALVFGGGHVVLSLLQTSVVPSGTISNEVFLAGYGAAQAVPGPLLTFAAYLGACASRPPTVPRSASLPTSTEPIRCAMPWASAGLMVYLLT